jgi:hypothetical protein
LLLRSATTVTKKVVGVFVHFSCAPLNIPAADLDRHKYDDGVSSGLKQKLQY